MVFTNERIPEGDGVGTPGWWRNKGARDGWPAPHDDLVGTAITIGLDDYTKAEAIAAMEDPTPGDKWGELFEQLVAAMLNVAAGNESACIATEITNANLWMATHTTFGPRPIAASSDHWQVAEFGPDSMSDVHATLDAYNNGLLCAPPKE